MNEQSKEDMNEFLRSRINDENIIQKISIVLEAFIDEAWCDGFDFANEHHDRLPIKVSPRPRIKADGTI